MSWYARQRAADRIAELATAGLGLPAFWLEATDALTRGVPHYLAPCWFTLDPTSLLVTSHFQEGLPEIPGEWLAAEYDDDGDVNKMADVARSTRGVATLHEATDGDPRRSLHYELSMVPFGAEQELIAALRTGSGQVWGAFGLYREPGRPMFDADDIAFVRSVAAPLAEGARRGLLIGEATDPEWPDAPGMVVLGPDWSVESATPGVEAWLSDVPGGDWDEGRLPPAVLAVAAQARGGGRTVASVGSGVARVRADSGRWLTLHGVVLENGEGRRTGVIVEPAHPARLVPLLMDAHGLTDREQDVTRCVLRGMSTARIGEHLGIAELTVQDHLKQVFAKTGVHSRRDLVGTVFATHYEPRVRDNERRAVAGNPMRGGPAATRR